MFERIYYQAVALTLGVERTFAREFEQTLRFIKVKLKCERDGKDLVSSGVLAPVKDLIAIGMLDVPTRQPRVPLSKRQTSAHSAAAWIPTKFLLSCAN